MEAAAAAAIAKAEAEAKARAELEAQIAAQIAAEEAVEVARLEELQRMQAEKESQLDATARQLTIILPIMLGFGVICCLLIMYCMKKSNCCGKKE